MSRVSNHPILSDLPEPSIRFLFAGREIAARPGEMISSALFAAGIRTFGHHHKDGAPQGIYCANGQCAQCMVLVDGRPLKACMTPAEAGKRVEPLDGLPRLADGEAPPTPNAGRIATYAPDVLVLGGGPAGLSAADELGGAGARVLLVDDKNVLGGKLVLQTHRFFGSVNAVHAGTRGIEIGRRLTRRLENHATVDIWTSSTALAVFGDRKVGVLRGDRYTLVEPRVLLVATGAREKALTFSGNTLPGVCGAGAFQTLVNRDRIRASERLFIVGGGNVGLIAGYHALQAGIEVVGLVEALPKCGGYKVHRDKLARLGVPLFTSHTVLAANGSKAVESVTIAEVDGQFSPISGTERTFACDTVLIAVGLDPVDEFLRAGKAYGLKTYAAGDAEEIAEASAAIFSGRISGRRIARDLGLSDEPIPEEWIRTAEILKSRPGETHARHPLQIENHAHDETQQPEGSVYPIFHCSQEIPCNPCTSVCPQGLIEIDPSDIRKLPEYVAESVGKQCIGCAKCVAVCPGLAITLVDRRGGSSTAEVLIPYEFPAESLETVSEVIALDVEGEVLATAPLLPVAAGTARDGTILVRISAPPDIAERIAGIRPTVPWRRIPLPEAVEPLEDASIVCRCERVTAGEIRALIRKGIRDMNQIKALTRAGMGACGGKTCRAVIHRLYREEGISPEEVVADTPRPLFVETPFGAFAGESVNPHSQKEQS